jgi:LuxR family maltose regulon positive regulatory protein
VQITLAIALILQAAFFAVWITAAAPASLAYILIALAAFAMGLQANAIRSLNVPGISTTAFTATYVDLASGIASWGLTAPSARRLVGTVAGVAAGGFLGDWMLRHAHPYGPIVPAAVPATVTWLGLEALRICLTSLSAPEIARELYVSVNTVRTHMRHLYDKLGAHRRMEALDRARTLGLLAPVPQRA